MMFFSLQISYQVDEEHLTQKRALHVLKVVLENMPLLISNDDPYSRDVGFKNKNIQANGDKNNERKMAIHYKTKRDRWDEMEVDF